MGATRRHQRTGVGDMDPHAVAGIQGLNGEGIVPVHSARVVDSNGRERRQVAAVALAQRCCRVDGPGFGDSFVGEVGRDLVSLKLKRLVSAEKRRPIPAGRTRTAAGPALRQILGAAAGGPSVYRE